MMKWLALIACCWAFAIACGLPANNAGVNRAAAVNINANAEPYSRSENAYTFAQNSIFARDLTPSGKGADEIVGKTVTESKLWDNKVFDRELSSLMGPDYATMKKFWNTETPIKKFGDFLMMTGCEQHNCADNQYVIFIDLGSGIVNVVHIGKDTDREWKTRGEIRYLPPPFEEELKRLKSRELDS